MLNKLFNRKRRKRDKALLEKYNRGQYLRLNEDVDNKEIMLQKKESIVPEPIPVKEPEPIVKQVPEKEPLLPHQKAEIEIRNKLKAILKAKQNETN